MKGNISLKLSIAMTTYNGSKFILEQLQSIASQSLLPDEIIICDDCSKDNTTEIIERFKENSHLNIKLIKNPNNLGVIKNFEKAITETTGDIIFLSDQDDYWFPQKLRVYTDAFENNKDVDFIFSDVQIADKYLNVKSGSLFSYEQKSNPERFVDDNHTNIMSFISMKLSASGATIAFRSKLRSFILPIPEINHLLHDGWIEKIALSTSKCMMLAAPYSKYRQHGNNFDGYKSGIIYKFKDLINLYNFRQHEYDYLSAIKERLISIDFDNKSKIIEIIIRKQDYLSKQIIHYNQKRYLRILLTIFEYQISGVYAKYYRGTRTFTKDILALIFQIIFSIKSLF